MSVLGCRLSVISMAPKGESRGSWKHKEAVEMAAARQRPLNISIQWEGDQCEMEMFIFVSPRPSKGASSRPIWLLDPPRAQFSAGPVLMP